MLRSLEGVRAQLITFVIASLAESQARQSSLSVISTFCYKCSMKPNQDYYIYFLTNAKKTTLYVGITNNLIRRIWQHKQGMGSKFTQKYNLTLLVYFEVYNNPITAISREKQIKAGSRKKKEQLINNSNPDWKDLYPDLVK